MKALSLYQPWASLIAVGVKTIETRSWATKYRGRLLIHAAAREPDRQFVGSWLAQPCSPGDEWDMSLVDGVQVLKRLPLPLGAVVASCTLTDCVPTEALGISDLPTWRGWHYQVGGSPYRQVNGPDTNPGPRRWPDLGVVMGTDQRPFGDFSPGRWAWLLDDVKPTTAACPRCWGEGEIGPGIEDREECPTCEGLGYCEGPVPMRGRQGLWAPTWEPVAA